MAQRRRYSDDERAACLAALAANNGDIAKTAREVGVPVNSLRQWASGKRHPEAIQLSQLKKPPLAGEFLRIAYQMLGIAATKAADLSAKDAMVAAGIAVDKWAILKGIPADADSRYDFTRLSEAEQDQFDHLLERAVVSR